MRGCTFTYGGQVALRLHVSTGESPTWASGGTAFGGEGAANAEPLKGRWKERVENSRK